MVSNSFPSQSGNYFYEPVMQASAIPYEVTEEGIRVCLIATQSKKRWVFPKASLEGRCSREVAIRAAREEAGVSGRISEKPVGRYKRLKGSCLYLVEVFPLEVTAYLRGWREIGERQRRWVDATQAAQVLVNPELQDMLWRALKTLGPQLTAGAMPSGRVQDQMS